MTVNLNECKKGDKLLSKHGLVLTYVEKLVDKDPEKDPYVHKVQYPLSMSHDGKNCYGTRTDSGHVFNNPEKRLDTDHDIVQILGQD